MKTQTKNPERQGKITRLFLTGCVLSSLTAGWLLGSFTTEAFSQTKSPENATASTLFSIPIAGETLPTVMLDEFSVTANPIIN